MFKRYKEIWFGILLGAAMWLMDAAMHAELGADVHSSGFWAEIFQPPATAVLFRSIYFVIATVFGVFLWRANWRERELRAFESAIIAFQRQLDRPALRILSLTRRLQNRNSVQLDETAAELAANISADAHLIEELSQKYAVFNQQVRNGETAQAIKTLRSIEMWLNLHDSTSNK